MQRSHQTVFSHAENLSEITTLFNILYTLMPKIVFFTNPHCAWYDGWEQTINDRLIITQKSCTQNEH